MLESMGIYGWAHLIQVIVLLSLIVFGIVYVIPKCSKDVDEMWEELTKGKASSVTSREAANKTYTVSSLPCKTGHVKTKEDK